jgi:hypothetical protein
MIEREVLEREVLEREIHQLRQIIRADAYALTSKATPITDRARLQMQIAIRTTMWVGLSKELSGASSRGTAETRGPRAQTKAYPRSEAHEGQVAANPLSPARPHYRDQTNAGEV